MISALSVQLGGRVLPHSFTCSQQLISLALSPLLSLSFSLSCSLAFFYISLVRSYLHIYVIPSRHTSFLNSYCDGFGLTQPRGLCTPGYFCLSGSTSSSPTARFTDLSLTAVQYWNTSVNGRPVGIVHAGVSGLPAGIANSSGLGLGLLTGGACPPGGYCPIGSPLPAGDLLYIISAVKD